MGVTKVTISNITKTLERKELCYRKVDNKDRRITYVMLTAKGKEVMEKLYPQFHKSEVNIVSSLNLAEQKKISKLLRRVIRENDF